MYNFAMVFGKIEYLNLLPFHIFMKRFTRSSQQSMSMHYKRGVPAKINSEFLNRRVDAAFISSVKAQNSLHVELGIIAKKEVLSVLVKPHNTNISDIESATSNVLANLLHVKGEVLIGDKALKYYLSGALHVDLAKEWNKKYNLPFVFAILCYHKDASQYKKIQKQFLKSDIKIPRYILNIAAQRTGISQKDILEYLKYISYKLDTKAKKGLSTFYKELRVKKGTI